MQYEPKLVNKIKAEYTNIMLESISSISPNFKIFLAEVSETNGFFSNHHTSQSFITNYQTFIIKNDMNITNAKYALPPEQSLFLDLEVHIQQQYLQIQIIRPSALSLLTHVLVALKIFDFVIILGRYARKKIFF